MKSFDCNVCGIKLGSTVSTSNGKVYKCLECIDRPVKSLEFDDQKMNCCVCLQSIGIGQFRLDKGKSTCLGTCADCRFKFGFCDACQNYSTNTSWPMGEYRPLDLLKHGVCSLDHHRMSENNTFKLFNISNGLHGEISKELKLQMQSLYLDFLYNLNFNPKIMKKRSVDDMMAMALKSKDELFKQLDVPVDVLHRKRILVTSFEQDLKDKVVKRQSRELRERKCLSGFIILEWHKKEGYTSLNNIVLKTPRLNSRILLDLTLIGFKVCVNQEKLESKKALDQIKIWYEKYGDFEYNDIPIWMYIQIPPPNKRLIGLVSNEHDPFFGKHLMSMGWSKNKDSKIAINDFMEWTISIEKLETFFFKNASLEEWEIWSKKPISEYLEWRGETRLIGDGMLKFTLPESRKEKKDGPLTKLKKEESLSKDSEIINQEFSEPPSKRPRNGNLKTAKTTKTLKTPKTPKTLKSPMMTLKKKVRHCRCCGSSECPGRGGGKFCSCHKPNCTGSIVTPQS